MFAPKSKICVSCNETKPTDDFHFKNRAKGILYPHCKVCRKERDGKIERIRDKERERTNSRKVLARVREERLLGINIAKHILTDSRGMDRKKSRTNDLDLPFIENMISKSCSYCGENEIRLTLDRVDNTRGHTKDNVVTACCRCNHARGDMPYDAWLCLVDGMRKARLAGLFGQWRAKPFSHTNAPLAEW